MNRVMRRALLVSILIHLVALLPFRMVPLPPESSRPAAGRSISAVLRAAPREQLRILPEDGREFVGRPLAPGIATLVKSGSASKPSIFPAISRSTVTDDIAVTERTAGAPVAQDIAQPVVDSSAEVPEAITLDSIRQYRLNLAREARRFKRYPELARERGWEGTVVVVVNTVAGRATPIVSVSQPSGFTELNLAALELLEMAIHTAALPESLRNRQFALTLPVEYRLGD